MKRYTVVLSALLFAVGCAANSPQNTPPLQKDDVAWDTDDIWQVKPTPDPESPSGVYVPTDLEKCFRELDKMLHPGLKAQMRSGPQEGMIQHHHGLGRWLRNNWGLWGGSHLAKYFFQRGIMHPDDMSGSILDAYWEHLNGEPVEGPEPVADDRWKPIWEQMHGPQKQ